MKNKLLLILVVVLLLVYLLKGSPNKETSFLDYNLVIKNLTTNNTFEMNMEDYLVGVLAGEMPASYDMEALKAQAVASRTYAYYKSVNSKKDYDLTTDNKTQVYIDDNHMKEKWGNNYENNLNKIKNAISETKGEIITYEGDVISAYFFSMSNGKTENSKDVFNEDKPYLVSVSSMENSSIKNYTRDNKYSYKELCLKLEIKDCSEIHISKINYNDTHHVTNITINNKVFAGINLRKLLGLYSTDFSVKVNNNEVVFSCNGHGHDVGMSQYGANLMAKNGYNYQEILKHYYTGVDINKINV